MSGKSLTLVAPESLDALGSPHRLEIVSALADAGQASIAELAHRLGRTPHSLYYHVRLLERAGVLVLADTRRSGRRDERVWKLAGDRILVGATPESPRSIEMAAKAADSMLRLTSRELRAAIGRTRPEAIGLRMKGRLGKSAVRRVRRLVKELEEIFRNSKSEAPARVYALTVVLTPSGEKES